MSWDLNPGSSQSSLSSVIICNQKLILKTSQDIFILQVIFLIPISIYVYQDSFDSDDSIMKWIISLVLCVKVEQKKMNEKHLF